jgi:hypothetical protein
MKPICCGLSATDAKGPQAQYIALVAQYVAHILIDNHMIPI